MIPGRNALLLHLGALGPRRLRTDGEGGVPAAPVALEDNEATWLDASDLVFMDPIGTGFSRPARPEYADDFYSVLGDIAATVEFIRTCRTRFDAWDAPVYLAGESYGVRPLRYPPGWVRPNGPWAEARRRALANRYLRNDLGFKTDLAYQGLESGYSSAEHPASVNERWKYDQGDPNVPVVVRNTDGPPGGTPPWLRRAMDLSPALRTFVATGMYDSLNSCPANVDLLSRLTPGDASRITFRCYQAGHMMYEDHQPRLDLARDIRRFYHDRGSR